MLSCEIHTYCEACFQSEIKTEPYTAFTLCLVSLMLSLVSLCFLPALMFVLGNLWKCNLLFVIMQFYVSPFGLSESFCLFVTR